MNKNVLVVIPARYNSTRLPGKPLKKIGNKTMIEHVYNRATKIGCAKVIVATDDLRIHSLCKLKKINVALTSIRHKTGSDRVAEIANKFNFKWVLNLQGDEPLINVSDIRKLIKKTLLYEKKNKEISVSTLFFFKKRNKKN